jgi:hypothetical protein
MTFRDMRHVCALCIRDIDQVSKADEVAALRKRVVAIETALLFGGYPTLKAQRNAVELVKILRGEIADIENNN